MRCDRKPLVLAAGPMQLRLQDGELRYLCVRGKEVLRRVYFAVRGAYWDTIPAAIEEITVERHDDRFVVELTASCRSDIAVYAWTGRIEGRPDGTVSVVIDGKALADFESPRIGLCVLFGGKVFAGQPYCLDRAGGGEVKGVFPAMISPQQFANGFTALHGTTREGIGLTVSSPGMAFDMEDQRNYGDSSYKAFTESGYGCPQVRAGDGGTHRLEISVRQGAETGRPTATVGDCVDAVLPRLSRVDVIEAGPEFVQINRSREEYANARSITIPFNPAVHLTDDEALMENIPAIVDQAATLRSFAPQARLHVGPVWFDTPYPRPQRDLCHRTAFATAWLVRFVKFAAIAGMDSIAVGLADGPWMAICDALSEHTGERLRAIDAAPHRAIEVLAVEGGWQWVANTTDAEQRASVAREAATGCLAYAPYEVREYRSSGDNNDTFRER